jgi:hypothetical protein
LVGEATVGSAVPVFPLGLAVDGDIASPNIIRIAVEVKAAAQSHKVKPGLGQPRQL